jgi:hypothetical protein
MGAVLGELGVGLEKFSAYASRIAVEAAAAGGREEESLALMVTSHPYLAASLPTETYPPARRYQS